MKNFLKNINFVLDTVQNMCYNIYVPKRGSEVYLLKVQNINFNINIERKK